MAFGMGFEHAESKERLDDGIYEAKIIGVEEKKWQSGDVYIALTFEIRGHAEAYPNTCNLNDSPKTGSMTLTQEQLMHIWNVNMTKFFANFGIKEGDFNTANWINHTGFITVRPQKNKPEYKEIVPFKTSVERKQAPQAQTADMTPAPVQTFASSVGGTVKEIW